MNPTASLMPALIAEIAPDSDFYGPGFVSEEALERGLLRWIDESGPYDAVFVGPWCPVFVDDINEPADRLVAFLQRSVAKDFKLRCVDGFIKDIKTNIGKAQAPVKLVSTLSFDYYAATQEQIDRLLAQGLTVVGPNHQFIQPLSELPAFAQQEKHYIKKANRLSDAWYDFAVSQPERFITALHYIAHNEFSYLPLSDRRYDSSIPGIDYYLRKQASEKLSRSSFKLAPKHYFNFFRLANKLGAPVYSKHIPLKLFNELFHRSLGSTKFVYTAKGGFGMPIRKFFEIPAAGAVLLCTPCIGYGDAGFRHGEHYLETAPEELPDRLAQLIHDPHAQQIANAGRKLVAAQHSLAARAKQIRMCIEAILAKQYMGSTWSDGQFLIHRKRSEKICAA
ncbi:glycosyltransferase [Hahella sp. KA22]|uniref:glycosyltransferase n=1 Tax=Hahella sp. KA22 TaxID=1628392 RepID=UPI0013E295AB|nr:glycosyltransferase [Hahella sp. KA22]